MIQKLILLIIIGGLVYLNVTNPKQAAHEDLLFQELQQRIGPIPEVVEKQIFGDLDFSNFMLFSAIKTAEDSKMLTLGYMKEVKLVHTEWPEEIRKKYRQYFEY